MESSFSDLAAVRLDDVLVLVPSPHVLPSEATDWPVHFTAANTHQPDDTKRIVLCGTASSVEAWLERAPSPLYVVTDKDWPTVCGRRNVHVAELAAAERLEDWEPVVAAICSRHVRGVARLIVDHAHARPDAEAVRDAHGSVTYAELCSMACAVGDALVARVPACAARDDRAAGRAGDVLVGVQLAPSIRSCAVMLGLTLRRLTPCDIAEAPATRHYMLQSAGCVALLVEKPIDGASDGGERLHGVPLVRVDALGLARDVPLAAVPRPGAASLGDAHIVGWTSGSTGKPKAMAVTNFRIAHWCRWRSYHLPAGAFGTRAAMNLFWIWYWHIPLSMGRTLVVTPSEANVDVVSLMAFVDETAASYIDCLTPSQMQLVLELCESLPPSLKHVVSSGEALPLATARAFLRKFPTVALHNLLATTETAADICMLKGLSLPAVDALLASGHTHAPILDRSAGTLGGVVRGPEPPHGPTAPPDPCIPCAAHRHWQHPQQPARACARRRCGTMRSASSRPPAGWSSAVGTRRRGTSSAATRPPSCESATPPPTPPPGA